MKFVAQTKALADALQFVSRVVERRNTYPILANVHLTAKDDQLTIRGTDLDIEVTRSVTVGVAAPGITTVPSAMLTDIVRKFAKDGEVTFALDPAADQARISSGRSKISLATLSPDSFPELKTATYHTHFEMEAPVLLKALQKVSFAVSSEETRYYLNGVFMHGVDDKERGVGVRFVATDGHRMARCFRAIEAAAHMPGIIIPRKTVGEIERLCELAGDLNVAVSVGDTRIKLEVGPTILASKLIEGTFPDYERVTPKNNNLMAKVDVKSLAAGVDRVSTIASDKGGKAVALKFTEDTLKLTVTNPDHGTADEEMAVDYPEAADHAIGFNAKYMLDILNTLGRGTAIMAMMDAGSPTLFTSVEDPTVAFVLMPMRV